MQVDATIPNDLGVRPRILIIAPHPDDETLAAGGMIASAVERGHQVRVIVATNGDASYTTALVCGSHSINRENFKHLALMRQGESMEALAMLGLAQDRVRFWGFPDRGLAWLWKSEQNDRSLYRSPATGHDHSVQAMNSRILAFTRHGLISLLDEELFEFCPTTIIMPHPCDAHSDHRALAEFTLLAVRHHIQDHRLSPCLLAYWMWRKGKSWFTGTHARCPGHPLLENDPSRIAETHLTLSPDMLEQKVRALHCYPSQKFAAGRLFRESSKRLYEAFTPLHLSRLT